MKFLESVGKLMSNVFAKQSRSTQEQWAKNLTLEQIEEYERQGMDMSAYKKIRTDEMARKKRLAEDSIAAVDLSRLDAYRTKIADGAFAGDVAKFNRIPENKMENATLVYACVVQAHQMLWEPQKDDYAAGLVFVFALDDAHRFNIEWLRGKAKEIGEMKESASVPADCREFIETLRNEQSEFCFPLGESLNEGADAWCATFMQLDKQSKQLPLGYIPHNRIIPFFLTEKPVYNRSADIQLIPPAYYTKDLSR
jgi:hypothetical protein